MKWKTMVSLFLCFCLLLVGSGSAQAKGDTSAETEELPFLLDLPEGTEIGECLDSEYSEQGEWEINSDRLSNFGKNFNDDEVLPLWDGAGWVILYPLDNTFDGDGRPYLGGNHRGFGNYEQYDFGWLCVMDCDVYTNTDIVTYDIPEAFRLGYFWCIAIPDEFDEENYHWILLNQLCFTKKEVLEIAESFSLTDAAKAAAAAPKPVELPFSLDLPEGVEVCEPENVDGGVIEWILNSDRWVGLDLYPDAIEAPEMIAAGWIRKTWGGETNMDSGVPSLICRNIVEERLLDEYEFGWFFEGEYEAYASDLVKKYDIPQEVNHCTFWCAVIEDKSEEDGYYWLALNQLCFTKEEAMEIAESFSLE